MHASVHLPVPFKYNEEITCRETIAVANLRKGSWIRDEEFTKLPRGVSPFGAGPAVIAVLDKLERREKIVVFSGINGKVSVK